MSTKRFLILLLVLTNLISCSKDKRSAKKGEDMQVFITDISAYTRNLHPNFIIIPQNGIELAFNKLEPDNGINSNFLSAIDGFGIEELFYNGAYQPDDYILNMCRKVKESKSILVADYVNNLVDEPDAISRSQNENFICFPRRSTNYDYQEIPTQLINENNDDITALSEAKNYLYLISSNAFQTKQAMIAAIAATNYDAVIIDAFFGDDLWTASETELLKTKANGGKRLIVSYMSIGSAENYRYYWKENWKLHKPRWLKKKYEGYEDEIWVKYWDKEWQNIIFGNDDSYTKKIINAGFDGVYLDNVEAFYFLYHKD